MKKREERDNPNSCWNRADDDELLFVLLERDVASPATIRAWARERIRLGKNTDEDPTIVNAMRIAREIEEGLRISQSSPDRDEFSAI